MDGFGAFFGISTEFMERGIEAFKRNMFRGKGSVMRGKEYFLVYHGLDTRRTESILLIPRL